MYIKPSTAIRNEYNAISDLARESHEPIYITRNGEGDGVYMNIEAFEERRDEELGDGARRRRNVRNQGRHRRARRGQPPHDLDH